MLIAIDSCSAWDGSPYRFRTKTGYLLRAGVSLWTHFVRGSSLAAGAGARFARWIMPNVCYFTGKKTRFGKKRAYGGAKISKGGFGLKTTGIARRTFKPNLQKVNAVIEKSDGTKIAKRVKVSTSAIRSGLVVKPLKRKYGYTRQQKEAAGN